MKKNHIKLNTLSRFEFFQKKREFKNMFSFLSLSHDLIKACVKGREYSQSYFASSCRKSSVIDSLLNHFGYLNQKSENLKINGLFKETSHCVFQTHTPLVRSFIRLIQSFVHREKYAQARCYFIIWKALQYKNRRGQKPDAAVFTFYGHVKLQRYSLY